MGLSENRAPSKLHLLTIIFHFYQFENEEFDPRHTILSGYFGRRRQGLVEWLPLLSLQCGAPQ